MIIKFLSHLLVLNALTSTLAMAAPEMKFGIAQSDLIWHINDQAYPADTMIADMARDGVYSLRTNMRSTASANDFARLITKANKSGMDVVVTILQDTDDYVKPIPQSAFGETNGNFTNLCGWAGGTLKFSMLDLNLYQARLLAHLNALKNSGAAVDAFEIGNELDWTCFNGDIPFGVETKADDPALANFLKKYDQVLQLSSTLIKQSFPKAKIVTFGAANCSLFSPASCLVDPQNFLAKLSSLNLADGIGAHIYPTDNAPFKSASKLVKNYASILGTTRTVWITETGFTNRPIAHLTLFQNLIDTFKATNIVSHFYAYTYHSYVGEDFSLSSGLGGKVDPAINLFAYAKTSSCLINLKNCPAHPEWNLFGTFTDNANHSSHSNQDICLSRADEYLNACKTQTPVTASYTVNGVVMKSKTTGVAEPAFTSCEITMKNCPAHPEWNISGTFTDSSTQSSNSNENACMARADDFFNACQPTSPVTASYLVNDVIVKQKTAGAPPVPPTSCQITMKSCPAHPEWNISGTFPDSSNANNSNSNESACMARADDFLNACKATSSVTASYLVNGIVVKEKTTGTVTTPTPTPVPATSCQITLSSCPKHPEWNISGTFIDSSNANNSNSNQAACLGRAKQFYDACLPPGTVKASYVEGGITKASKVAP